MAEVYRAKASGAGGFEKHVAVKLILPTYTSNEEFQRMFEYEARLSSLLNHANIVQVYDFVKANDTYLLAMEYVDGRNLRQFINKARKLNLALPIEFACYVINEVCKGLEYAHRRKDDLSGSALNIIHRDMSPQNIMLSFDGAVKIVDFGIAKAKDRVDETRSGVIKGKFGYMSPEQANGESIDHRSDIFSTGIILFELLTGKRLFSAESDLATLKQIQECLVPPPSRQNPKITYELEKILLKALTKMRETRYQDAGLFHRQLQEYLNKYYPSFTQKEVSEIIHKAFEDEILENRKRIEQLYQQPVPYSQVNDQSEEGAAPSPLDEIEQQLEGSVTGAEQQSESQTMNFDANSNPSHTLKAEVSEVSIQRSRSVPSSLSRKEPIIPISNQKRAAGDEDRTLIGDTNPEFEPPPESDLSLPVIHTPTPSTEGEEATLLAKKKHNKQNTGISINIKPKGATDPSISLVSAHESTPVRSVDQHSYDEPKFDWKPEPEPFHGSEKNQYVDETRSKFSVIIMGIMGLITFGIYQFYLSGGLPRILRGVAQKEPKLRFGGKQTQPKETTGDETSPVAENCMMKVDTDPSGARVWVDGVEKGVTSTTISNPCGKSLKLDLQLAGYETITQNVTIHETNKDMMLTLKKLSTGSLEIIPNRNVKIYVDGELLKEAQANSHVELSLSGNKKHKLRFVNEIYSIDAEREYFIEPEKLIRDNVNFDEKSPAPISRGNKRR